MVIHSNATHLYKYQYLRFFFFKKTYIFQSELSEKHICASLHGLVYAVYKNGSWATLEEENERNFTKPMCLSTFELFLSPSKGAVKISVQWSHRARRKPKEAELIGDGNGPKSNSHYD